MDELMKKAKKEYEAANAGTTIELVPIEAEQDQ
jgi:multiple sugar transport system substrate-binding protein